jgi:hypothetical protein
MPKEKINPFTFDDEYGEISIDELIPILEEYKAKGVEKLYINYFAPGGWTRLRVKTFRSHAEGTSELKVEAINPKLLKEYLG